MKANSITNSNYIHPSVYSCLGDSCGKKRVKKRKSLNMRLEIALLKMADLSEKKPLCFNCDQEIYKYDVNRKNRNNKSFTVNGTVVVLRSPKLPIRIFSGDAVFFCHSCFDSMNLQSMGFLDRYAFLCKELSENCIETKKEDIWKRNKRYSGCYGMGKRR